MYSVSDQHQILSGGSRLPEPDLKSTDRFWQVISPLQQGNFVPYSIVLLGLYSGELEKETDQQLPDTFDKNLPFDCPETQLPAELLYHVAVYLKDIEDELAEAAKKQVGVLHKQTGLNQLPGNAQSINTIQIHKQPELCLYTGNGRIEIRNVATEDIDVHQCDRCGEVFDRQSALQTHKKNCTEDDDELDRSCPYCGSKYDTPEKLTSHIRNCNSNPTHGSKDASGTSDSAQAHQNAQCACENCGTIFDSQTAFTQHKANCGSKTKQSSTNTTQYACIYCEEQFEQRRKLQEHERSCRSDTEYSDATNTPQYSCTNCDEQFEKKAELKKHENSCEDETDSDNSTNGSQYSCVYCDEKFAKKARVIRHEKSCDDKGDSDSSKGRPAHGKKITKRGGERVTGKNPFADTSKLKDAGLHKGGEN